MTRLNAKVNVNYANTMPFAQGALTVRAAWRSPTRPVSVSGATIRAMPHGLERLPAPVSPAAPGAGPAAVAGELLGRALAELSAGGVLGEWEQA